MPALKMPLPYFAKAPITYERSYLDSVVRSFSIYLQQQNNPGDLVVATLQALSAKIGNSNTCKVATTKSPGLFCCCKYIEKLRTTESR